MGCYKQRMIEVREPEPDNVSAFEAAAYILELSRELAAMADKHRLSKLAAALELARGLAGEALASMAVDRRRTQSSAGNAAPDDAA